MMVIMLKRHSMFLLLKFYNWISIVAWSLWLVFSVDLIIYFIHIQEERSRRSRISLMMSVCLLGLW
jgi:hypothetical protein